MHSQTGSQRGGDHGNMGRRVSIGGIRRCSVSVVNRRTSVLGGGGIAVNGIKEEHVPESVQNTIDERLKATKEFEQKKETEIKQHRTANVIDPDGVLAVHIKTATIHSLESEQFFERSDANVYFRLHSGGITKCSSLYENVTAPNKLILDDIKHFCIRPNRRYNDPSNFLRLEILTFDPDNPLFHRVLTAKEVHVYKLIKQLYCVETIVLRRVDKLIAQVDLEFCFSYGTHGYGTSNQLENRQRAASDQLEHSLFCRLPPPVDRLDEKHDIMQPTAVGHPSFISFTKTANIGSTMDEFGQELEGHDWRTIEEPVLLITKIRKSMHHKLEEYSRLCARQARLDFLKREVMGDVGSVPQEGFQETFEVSEDFHLRRRTKGKYTRLRQDHESKDEAETEELDIIAKILGSAPGVVKRVRTWMGNKNKISPGQDLEPDDEDDTTGQAPNLLDIRHVWKRVSMAVQTINLPKPPIMRSFNNRTTHAIEEEDEVEEESSPQAGDLLKMTTLETMAKSYGQTTDHEGPGDSDGVTVAEQPGSLMSRVLCAMYEVLEEQRTLRRVVEMSTAARDLQRPGPGEASSSHTGQNSETQNNQISSSGQLPAEQRRLRSELEKMSPARVRRISVQLENLLNMSAPAPAQLPVSDSVAEHIVNLDSSSVNASAPARGAGTLIGNVTSGISRFWWPTKGGKKTRKPALVIGRPRIAVTPATPEVSDEEDWD